MEFKVFCDSNFVGKYGNEIFNDEVLSKGSIVKINDDKYRVLNIIIRKNDEVVLETTK